MLLTDHFSKSVGKFHVFISCYLKDHTNPPHILTECNLCLENISENRAMMCIHNLLGREKIPKNLYLD